MSAQNPMALDLSIMSSNISVIAPPRKAPKTPKKWLPTLALVDLSNVQATSH